MTGDPRTEKRSFSLFSSEDDGDDEQQSSAVSSSDEKDSDLGSCDSSRNASSREPSDEEGKDDSEGSASEAGMGEKMETGSSLVCFLANTSDRSKPKSLQRVTASSDIFQLLQSLSRGSSALVETGRRDFGKRGLLKLGRNSKDQRKDDVFYSKAEIGALIRKPKSWWNLSSCSHFQKFLYLSVWTGNYRFL